jgi:hypothetical protein
MIKMMAEAWFIRVGGREFGPADVETLREWKIDGRVLPTNEARPAGVDPAAVAGPAEEALWITAAEIPGLFEPPPVQTASEPGLAQAPQRTFAQILGDSFRIYGRGFFQYLFLTLLVALPSICAQLSGSAITPASTESPDLGAAIAELFTFAMFLLSLVAWPIFIAGIQIVTAELVAGRRPKVVDLLGELLKFWPRVAGLCLFVYGIFSLLMLFAVGIMVMLTVSGSSVAADLLGLGLLVLQVWLFGRFFVNVLFWQQFAVLADSDVTSALRQSKMLARSGRELPRHQRPMWRGVLIASLWFAFVFALYIGPEWSLVRQYLHAITTSTDPQAMLDNLRATQQSPGFNLTTFSLSLLQTVLRPLLGIGFVLVYLDSRRTNQIER